MNDEVSLTEIWSVIVRGSPIIIVTCLLVMAVMGVYAYLTPEKYLFSTAVEIGSYAVTTENGRDRRLIEPSVSVERKLRLAYIPFSRSRFSDQQNKHVPQVDLTKDSGSRLFILSTEGSIDDEKRIGILHGRIVDLLINDHQKVLQNLVDLQQSSIRQKRAELQYQQEKVVQQAPLQVLQMEYEKARQAQDALEQNYAIKISGLKAERQTIEADLQGVKSANKELKTSLIQLDERERLLRLQIEATENRLSDLRTDRDGAVAEASQNANAVVVLMVGSEVAQTERTLWNLRNQLGVQIKGERAQLERKLADNAGKEKRLSAALEEIDQRHSALKDELPAEKQIAQVEIDRLKNAIAKGEKDNVLAVTRLVEEVQSLESELADMTQTRTLHLAIKSIESLPPSGLTLTALGGILGLLLGLVIVGLRYFSQFPSQGNYA